MFWIWISLWISFFIIIIAIVINFNKNSQNLSETVSFKNVKIASEVQGTEAYAPIISVGETTIETEVQTICWRVSICGGGYNIIETEPKNYVVNSNEPLRIEFNDYPLPNTINLRIEELPSYHEQFTYIERDNLALFNYILMLQSKPSYIELPNEPGTYTYNMLVYWFGDKATTQGMANYRFSITVQ